VVLVLAVLCRGLVSDFVHDPSFIGVCY
jgi:hypothetical protein